METFNLYTMNFNVPNNSYFMFLRRGNCRSRRKENKSFQSPPNRRESLDLTDLEVSVCSKFLSIGISGTNEHVRVRVHKYV